MARAGLTHGMPPEELRLDHVALSAQRGQKGQGRKAMQRNAITLRCSKDMGSPDPFILGRFGSPDSARRSLRSRPGAGGPEPGMGREQADGDAEQREG